MLDWIINPEGVSYPALIVFVIGSIAAVSIGFVVGLTKFYKNRERRDGLR